jgi:fibronectin-binding autotransporter adhesin
MGFSNSKKAVLTATALAVALAVPAVASAATYTWTGGGASGDWSDTGNWLGGTVGSPTQTTFFNTANVTQNNVLLNVKGNFGGIVVGGSANQPYSITINPTTVGVGGYSAFQFLNTFSVQDAGGTGASLTLNGTVRPYQPGNIFNAQTQNIVMTEGVAFRNDINKSVALQASGGANVVIEGGLANAFSNNTDANLLKVANAVGGYTILTNAADSFQPQSVNSSSSYSPWTGGVNISNQGDTGDDTGPGALMVENGNTDSATGSGPVNMDQTGAILGGVGTVGGTVTMNAASVLKPGITFDSTFTTPSPSTGTLSLGALDMNGKLGTFDFYLSGSSNSLISVTGALTLSSTGVISLSGTPMLGTYHLFDYGSLVNPSDLSSWTITGPSGFNYSLLDNMSNSSIDLVVAATPEPAALGMLALGAGVCLLGLKRRKSA